MTAQHHVNVEDELLSVRIDGPIDLVDVYELAQSILRDPAFDHAWPQLIDIRGMQLRVRPGALKPFKDYIVGHYRPATEGAMALVVDGDLDSEQVAGIFRLVCAMPNTEMFDDYALAIKWLLSRSWHHPDLGSNEIGKLQAGASLAAPAALSSQQPDPTDEHADDAPKPERTGERNEAGERFLAAAHGQLPHGDPGPHC